MRMKTVVPLLACVVLASFLPMAPALADVDVDVRGGGYTDTDGPFVGAGVLTPIGDSHQWYFNPNAEAAFGDDRDLLSANLDVHYDLPTSTAWTVWLGGGPALLDRNLDAGVHGDEGFDVGANLLVGTGARKGDYRPYVQGKVLFSDDTELVVGAGLRF